MKSIRTPLSKNETELFRTFLDSIGLRDIIIGDYERIDENWYTSRRICYAYSKKSDEVVAILTHISLKYGSIQQAYDAYTLDLLMSNVGDTYFNWTP
jgi:hypothetical protein